MSDEHDAMNGVNRFRALWPMEWHRQLLALSCCGALAVVAALYGAFHGAWVAAAALATLAFVLIARLLEFRFYWTWLIQVDESGVHQLGGMGRTRAQVQIHVPWQVVTVWQRTRITQRGRPKVRGEVVYRYEVGAEAASPIVGNRTTFHKITG